MFKWGWFCQPTGHDYIFWIFRTWPFLLSFLRLFLSSLFFPFFYLILACSQPLFPSQTFPCDKADMHTFINDTIYLSCVPFLSFVLALSDHSLPRGTWWFLSLLYTALKPRDLEKRLHERYMEWIEETRRWLKICPGCARLKPYSHNYISALQKCWNKASSLQPKERVVE